MMDLAQLAATVIGAIGAPSFADTLDQALGGGAGFDLSATIGFPPGQHALLLHDAMRGSASPEVMRNYLHGAYLFDPAYTACMSGVSSGFHRLDDLAADRFREGEYCNSPLVHPCISMEPGSLVEEVIFLVPVGSGHYLTHSLMRSRGARRFSQTEAAWLGAVAPVVVAALAKHWRRHQHASPSRSAQTVGGDALQPILATFAQDRLTRREQTIVGLVLRGHSSASVAAVLGIAEGTVKNHRKHIHCKLGISGQAELFAQFVTYILSRHAGGEFGTGSSAWNGVTADVAAGCWCREAVW